MTQNNKQVRQAAVQEFKKSLDQLQERLQGVESVELNSVPPEVNAREGSSREHDPSFHPAASAQTDSHELELPPLDPQVLEEAAQDIERYMRSRQGSS